MPKLVRSIGAVMMLIESINGRVLYPELGKMAEGVTDRETIRTLLAGAPVGAFLVVIVGWVLGALAGGFLVAGIGRDAPERYALILGGLLTLAGIANNLMLPPPAWFWLPTLVVFLPAASVGARLALKAIRPRPSGRRQPNRLDSSNLRPILPRGGGMTNILLLGTEKSTTSGIESLLRQDRHIVYLFKDVQHWHTAAMSRDFDLIIAAIRPSEPIVTTGHRGSGGFPTPILIVQADPERPNAVRGDARVVDRISIPFTAENLLARVDGLIRARRIVLQLRADSNCNDCAANSSAEPDGMFSHFADRLSSILNARIAGFVRPPAPYAGVATRVAEWADRRDAFEPGHAERVSTYAAMIARGIRLSRDEATTTVRAARLHDIGKVALPLEILRQKTPLVGNQKRLLETHAERGASILQSLNADPSIVDAIRHHHVRFDRKGLGPQHAGEIPRSARVLAAAEVYDAMTSSQFRPALTQAAAMARMSELRGGQLDPDCVDALIAALRTRPEKCQLADQTRRG